MRQGAPLALSRRWGGRDIEEVALDDGPTVFIAGIQRLSSWADRRPGEFPSVFPREQRTAVVLFETHRLVDNEHRSVFVALGLRLKHEWRHP